MKTPSLRGTLILIGTMVSLVGGSVAKADTYAINNASGGAGTWQDGNATTLWYDFNTNTSNLSWDNSLQNTAFFGNGGSGTVTVVGGVSTNYMEFNGSGDYTLTGDTITKNSNTSGYGTVIVNDTNNNVTIDNNLLLDTAGNTDRFNIVNNGTGTVTINGNITYINSGGNTNNRSLIFNGASGSKFVLNGTFSLGTSGNQGSIRFSEGSSDNTSLYLYGDYTGLNTGTFVEVPQGTVYLGTSKTGTGNIVTYNGGSGVTDVHTIETLGSQTIGNNINAQVRNDGMLQAGFVTVGQYDVGASSFTGNVNMDSSGLHLAAINAGSKVTFNTISGNPGAGGPLQTVGAGTVVLSAGSSFGNYNFTTSSYNTVAADLKAAHTLLTNTTGSAFGGSSAIVMLESGKDLGGTGISSQQISAVDGTSSITAGMGAATDVLTLSGGVAAASGLTMNFTLDGSGGASEIALGAGSFTLGGTVTVNLTSLDNTVLTDGTPYVLAAGSGTWSDSGASFVFNGPASYNVASYTFGPLGGQEEFTVQFSAVPEPSTYALMLGGAGLVLAVRMRRLLA